MTVSKNKSHDYVILFCRYPVPNLTKTRLIPTLGPVGAAELHNRLVLKTLQTAIKAAKENACEIGVCFDGTSINRVSQWLGPSLSYNIQRGEDLGERLNSAFNDAFMKGYQRVVLIGTDIPGLDACHIKDAFESLLSSDIVLGPSKDGGYWLVGMKRRSNIFRVNNWGGSDVLEQTIELAKKEGLSLKLLENLSDIDTGEDLKTWKPDEEWKRPYLSVVIPALNEASNIESTIKSAFDPEVEIIVVDGGSSDGTVAIAESAGARIIRSRQGRALQLNEGAGAARAEVLLFLHADTILPENFSSLIFESLLERSVVGGAFRFKTDLSTRSFRVIEYFTNLRSRRLNLPYGDQALFVRRHIFRKIGGFPDVPVGEDLIFVRLLSKEGKIVLSPASVITSARRWRAEGVFRIWFKNQLILFGILAGLPPRVFAPLKNKPVKFGAK